MLENMLSAIVSVRKDRSGAKDAVDVVLAQVLYSIWIHTGGNGSGAPSPHTRYPRRYGIPIDGMYRFMEEPYRQVWPARSLTAFDPEACLAMKMKAYLSARLEGVLRGRDTSRQLLLVYVVV
jgi:hypothetical protein